MFWQSATARLPSGSWTVRALPNHRGIWVDGYPLGLAGHFSDKATIRSCDCHRTAAIVNIAAGQYRSWLPLRVPGATMRGEMRPVAVRPVKVAGVISGVVLAWLVQPLLVPPFTARARVGIGPGELADFVHMARTLLNAACQAYAWQKPGYKGPRADGFRNPDGRQDALEVFVTTRDRESALAILNDWTARMLEARPGLRVLVPPTRDRFEDPNLLVVLVGAIIGWLVASMIIDRRRDPDDLPDWAG